MSKKKKTKQNKIKIENRIYLKLVTNFDERQETGFKEMSVQCMLLSNKLSHVDTNNTIHNLII